MESKDYEEKEFVQTLTLEVKDEYELYEPIREISSTELGLVILVKKKENQKVYVQKVISVKQILAEHVKELIDIQNVIKSHVIDMKDVFISSHKVGVKENLICITEYADGGSLGRALKKAKEFTEEQILQMFYQVCKGVHQLHKEGIMHRELKPDNILFVKKKVKVSEYGFEKLIPQQKQKKYPLGGQAGYKAPEQILSENNLDTFNEIDLEKSKNSPKIDIFAIGCLIYFSCTNDVPYDENEYEYEELLKLMEKQDYDQIPDQYSNFLKDLIKQFLQFHPLKRIELKKAMDSIEQRLKQMDCKSDLGELSWIETISGSAQNQ